MAPDSTRTAATPPPARKDAIPPPAPAPPLVPPRVRTSRDPERRISSTLMPPFRRAAPARWRFPGRFRLLRRDVSRDAGRDGGGTTFAPSPSRVASATAAIDRPCGSGVIRPRLGPRPGLWRDVNEVEDDRSHPVPGGAALQRAPASAQDFRGRINGTVTDNTGAVLPGVTVTATSPALIQPQVQVTGARRAIPLHRAAAGRLRGGLRAHRLPDRQARRTSASSSTRR